VSTLPKRVAVLYYCFLLLAFSPHRALFAQQLDSLGPPPIQRDTIRVTRSVRKVPPVFHNRQIRLMNRVARDVPQIALPPDFSATFVDSALVTHEHVTALEDYFSALVETAADSSLFDVQLADTVLPSVAWIKAWAWQQANLRLRERFVFQSADERKNFKESLEKNFRRKIDIEITLRSPFAQAIHLDTVAHFNIFMKRDAVQVPPAAIRYGPVKTQVEGNYFWYERTVTIEFPRFVRARDFWRGNTATLVIQPKKHSDMPVTHAAEYRFIFHAPRVK
jgi:hypothetical protein